MQASVFPTDGMPGGNGLDAFGDGTYEPDYWGGAKPQSTTPGVQLGRSSAAAEALDGEPPSTKTSISPPEHTVASDTTTSAPPNPNDTAYSSSTATNAPSAPVHSPKSSATTSRPSVSATRNTSASATPPSTPPTSQPATSTSATPAIVIPDEPGNLASNARVEEVETITVGEKDSTSSS